MIPVHEERPIVWIKCEVCGKYIMQSQNGRRKYCPICAELMDSNRSPTADHKKYKPYARRIQPGQKPQYTIGQVAKRANQLGMTYGKCSQLLAEGKISIEDEETR